MRQLALTSTSHATQYYCLRQLALTSTSDATQCSSLTPAVYARVGEQFRARYGSHAGWAHSVLFAAELPSFRRDAIQHATLQLNYS